MMTTFLRIIKYGWLGFWRTKNLAVPTLFIMVLMLELLISFVLLHETVNFIITRLQEKVDISVYFERGASEDEILRVADVLGEMPGIKEVKYISAAEAQEKFSQWHKNEPSIIESLQELGQTVLPASLNIVTAQPWQYAQVSKFLQTGPFKHLIKKIDYEQRRPIIERLFFLSTNLKRTVIVFILIVGLVSFLLVFNQIKMAIDYRGEEIKIMRLVGSPNFFLGGQFLITGLVIGAMAIFIAFLIVVPLLYFLNPKISLLFPGLSIFGFFKENLLKILLLEISFGLGLAVSSSLFAVKKYLKI